MKTMTKQEDTKEYIVWATDGTNTTATATTAANIEAITGQSDIFKYIDSDPKLRFWG